MKEFKSINTDPIVNLFVPVYIFQNIHLLQRPSSIYFKVCLTFLVLVGCILLNGSAKHGTLTGAKSQYLYQIKFSIKHTYIIIWNSSFCSNCFVTLKCYRIAIMKLRIVALLWLYECQSGSLYWYWFLNTQKSI